MDLADAVPRSADRLKLLEVGPAGRRECVVTPAFAAPEGSGLAVERPGDDPPHGVLADHHAAGRLARRVQVRLGQALDMSGDLEHRVGRGVEDGLAGLEVASTVLFEYLGAAEWAVTAEAKT